MPTRQERRVRVGENLTIDGLHSPQGRASFSVTWRRAFDEEIELVKGRD